MANREILYKVDGRTYWLGRNDLLHRGQRAIAKLVLPSEEVVAEFDQGDFCDWMMMEGSWIWRLLKIMHDKDDPRVSKVGEYFLWKTQDYRVGKTEEEPPYSFIRDFNWYSLDKLTFGSESFRAKWVREYIVT